MGKHHHLRTQGRDELTPIADLNKIENKYSMPAEK